MIALKITLSTFVALAVYSILSFHEGLAIAAALMLGSYLISRDFEGHTSKRPILLFLALAPSYIIIQLTLGEVQLDKVLITLVGLLHYLLVATVLAFLFSAIIQGALYLSTRKINWSMYFNEVKNFIASMVMFKILFTLLGY
jgi:hypothetical protein